MFCELTLSDENLRWLIGGALSALLIAGGYVHKTAMSKLDKISSNTGEISDKMGHHSEDIRVLQTRVGHLEDDHGDCKKDREQINKRIIKIQGAE